MASSASARDVAAGAPVVGALRLAACPERQRAAVDYWDMCRDAVARVEVELRSLSAALLGQDAAGLRAVVDAVRCHPRAPGAGEDFLRVWAELRERADDAARAALVRVERAAAEADAVARLSVHVGLDCVDVAPLDADDVLRILAATPAPSVADTCLGRGPATTPTDTDTADVCVVVPFRDRTPDRSRLRNLLACLAALRDQSLPRRRYRVVVVEADSQPWARDWIAPWCDAYVPLTDGGHFNKAWALNVGVVQAAGACRVLALLDADVLVDRSFVERNLSRFDLPGVQAHQPFLDALCCDEETAAAAVLSRLAAGRESAELSRLSGTVLRRPPGHCVWVRREVFDRVQGFDERFVGWGGEDLDFVFRVQVVASFDRFDDPLVHLHHERPVTEENGVRFYAERQLLTWAPIEPYGQPDRPARSRDDSVADLITRA